MTARAKLIAQRYFEDKGYKNADINIYQRDDVSNENQVILYVDVDKKQKIKVKQIVIEGNDKLTDKKLKGGLFRKGAFKKLHETGKFSSFLKSKNIHRNVGQKIKRMLSKNTTKTDIVMLSL